MEPPKVSARLFGALQTVNVDELSNCSDVELRPVLASLVRMSLIASLDKSAKCSEDRTCVLRILSRIELVNNLVALLSIDFHALETDVRKEMMLRSKVGNASGDSVLISNLNIGPALEFERSDATRRLRLVLSELLAIMGQIQSSSKDSNEQSGTSSTFNMKQSELFDHLVYLSEVCDVLAIAMAELPNLLSPPEVAEALLRLKYGPYIICHIVANQPDCFSEVVNHLLKLGDKQDDDYPSRVRQQALLLLCQMDPTQNSSVRNKCVELQKMPGLAISLALQQAQDQDTEDPSDIVSFMSGLILGADATVRQWVAIFIRSGQKRRSDVLIALRASLLQRLSELITAMQNPNVKQQTVVKSASILRLYTALRGIAGLKFTDEEIGRLMDLITTRPPVTSAGVKFVSLGLCMLIACNSLTGSSSASNKTGEMTLEQRAIHWINWLVDQEATFEQKVACSASFAEMLLLMAIHFHSNQLNAIGDLVFQTLGMKRGEIAIRNNSMSKIKQIFTHEVFTDKKVASHAVRVPVTKNLNSGIHGFLPVHCVHQLLKSRAFSKYKVPIKDWVFRQICVCTTPLHPVMPALIETFVNSILVPASSRGSSSNIEQTNEPISEKQVRAVFRRPAFVECNTACSTSCPTPVNTRSPKRKSRSRESTPASFRLFTPQTPNSSRSASPSQSFIIPSNGAANSSVSDDQEFNITTQILMLYYVLLYESVRLAHMKTILTAQRKVLRYSHELFADLPIKFLLQTAERDQERFGGIFPQLLRLCSSHFPHLCLVQDWLSNDDVKLREYENVDLTIIHDPEVASRSGVGESQFVTESSVKEALLSIKSCSSKLTLVFKKLIKMPAQDVWQYSEMIVEHIADLLEPITPYQLLDLFNKVWFRMNTVFPRKLWAITVNHLNHVNGLAIKKRITQDDLVLDPLQVLRCDRRVFRTSPLLEIILYITKACLAASRTHLAKHIQDNPILERATPNNQVSNDSEREELKNALVATQESAAVQIILEAGLLKDQDEHEIEEKIGHSNVKEIRLICGYLHESFIADPTLAKLVHFQGYPLQLLPIIVAGVPSMHICLDFAPELLSQPDLEKQAFAVDLISHLSIQYSLPKSYSVARLAVNSLSTLLSVLTSSERNVLFPPILPSLMRFCKAFPPLIEDVIGLLLQYGRICASESCINGAVSPKNFDMTGSTPMESGVKEELCEQFKDITNTINATNSSLAHQIQLTFTSILENSVLEKRIF